MNTTTINAVAEAIHQCHFHPVDWDTKEWRNIYEKEKTLYIAMALAAIEAYEKESPVKVMTVEEVADVLARASCRSWYSKEDDRPHAKARRTKAIRLAKSLVKLGTIRIVGGGE